MSYSKQCKTQKVEDECCVFNKEWTEKHIFTDVGSKAICLIYHESVAVFKDYNLKGQFENKHPNYGHNLSLRQQQMMFTKSSSLQKNVTKTSFILTNNIAKHNKPFAKTEFIKDCVVDAVSVVSPEIKSKTQAIPTSRRTNVRRIDSIAVNVQEQLSTATTVSTDFQWFFYCFELKY